MALRAAAWFPWFMATPRNCFNMRLRVEEFRGLTVSGPFLSVMPLLLRCSAETPVIEGLGFRAKWLLDRALQVPRDTPPRRSAVLLYTRCPEPRPLGIIMFF